MIARKRFAAQRVISTALALTANASVLTIFSQILAVWGSILDEFQ